MPNQTKASITAASTCQLFQMQGWCSSCIGVIFSLQSFSSSRELVGARRLPAAPRRTAGGGRRPGGTGQSRHQTPRLAGHFPRLLPRPLCYPASSCASRPFPKLPNSFGDFPLQVNVPVDYLTCPHIAYLTTPWTPGTYLLPGSLDFQTFPGTWNTSIECLAFPYTSTLFH